MTRNRHGIDVRKEKLPKKQKVIEATKAMDGIGITKMKRIKVLEFIGH